MKVSKKLLSLVLCLVMLISTMAVGLGLSASADNSLKFGEESVALTSGVNDLSHSSNAGYDNSIPSYNDLCTATGSTKDSFVYYGAKYYTLDDSANKVYLDKSKANTLNKGDELYIEVYYMTNYKNYKTANVAFAFDGRFFDFENMVGQAEASTSKVQSFFSKNFSQRTTNPPVNTNAASRSYETRYSETDTSVPYIAYVGSKYNYFHLTDAPTGADCPDNGTGLPVYIGSKYNYEDVKNWRVVCFPLKTTKANTFTLNWQGNTSEVLTTFKVTVKEDNAGSGSVILPSYYFNIANEAVSGAYSNGVFLNCLRKQSSTTKTAITSAKNAKTSAQEKPTYFINDCNCNFSLPGTIVKFVDGEKTYEVSFASGAALTQENAASGTIPTEKEITDLYGWEDENHNIVDLAKTTVTEEKTFYAVKKSQKVNVTLSLKNSEGGIYKCDNLPDNLKTKYNAVYSADNNTITMQVPITGLTSEELKSITVSGGSFYGWVSSAREDFNGSFKSAASNQTFSVKAGIPVKYLPIDGTEEFVDESIGGTYPEQEWSTLFYYDASYGSKLTSADLVEIQKEINKNYNVINEGTGAAAYGTDIQFCIKNEGSDKERAQDSSKIEVSKTLSETEAQYAAFSIGTTYNDTVTKDTIGNYVIGQTADAIYINTAVEYKYEIKIPSIDGDGNVEYKDENSKVNTVYYLAIGQKSKQYNKASQYTAFIWNESLVKAEVTSINNVSKAVAKFNKPSFEYDANTYYLTYTDKNGKTLSNLTTNDKTISFSRVKDENGNAIKNCAYYVCYITPQKMIYHIGIKVGDNIYSTGKPYYYGDTIKLDAFSELARQSVVYQKYAQGKDELYENNKTAISDLYYDGTAVGKAGYSLSSITYDTGNGTIDFMNEDNAQLVINEELVKKGTKYNYDSTYPNTFITFNASWIGSDYTFNVYYQNAESEWVHAITKVYSTGDSVSYESLIGKGSTLDQEIKADHPYGYVPGNALSKEQGGESWDNIKAEYAANENNSIDLYVTYSVDQRYLLVDYNNAYDENGQRNENEEAYTYDKKGFNYGAVIYDPSYTADSGTERPYANKYLVDPEINIKKPYDNCQFNGFKVYYVDGVYSSVADLPDKSEWKEGFNDKNETGVQHIYTTTIIQAQWIADSNFLFKVYDDQGKISFAMGKGFTRYYWNVKGCPCNKGENVLVEDPDTYYCVLFKIVKEDTGYSLKAKTIDRARLNMIQPTTFLFGTLWPLITKLILG